MTKKKSSKVVQQTPPQLKQSLAHPIIRSQREVPNQIDLRSVCSVAKPLHTLEITAQLQMQSAIDVARLVTLELFALQDQ